MVTVPHTALRVTEGDQNSEQRQGCQYMGLGIPSPRLAAKGRGPKNNP